MHARDAEPLLQCLDLVSHILADAGIKVGQGLVEQQHLRADRQRAAERDALPLTAGKGGYLALSPTTGPPVKAGPAVVDFISGIHLYAAAVTALFERERPAVAASSRWQCRRQPTRPGRLVLAAAGAGHLRASRPQGEAP
jgi:hypothetical protein